jgi:exonuclease VII large subunit
VDGKRSNSPTGNPPSVGRTPTPSELAHEIRKMREMVAQRLEHVEAFTDGEVMEFIRRAGAQYDTVSHSLVTLSAQFDSATKTVREWRDDIRRELAEHDFRLLAVEEKSTKHHVRLDTHDETLDDQQVRIRSLEQHRDGDARELALTRRQKTGMAALGTAGGGIAWLLSHLLGG